MPSSQDPHAQAHASSSAGSQKSLIVYTVVALGVALFIRFVIAAPYVVSGASMEPTFENWDYLIIDRVSYDFHEPERGDVIVLDMPENTSRALIKRVIGLPGDSITISGPEPTVTVVNAAHPEGIVLQEPYVSGANHGGATDIKVTLGKDEYFVLGDNRRVSADSRLWGILPRHDIVGRVFVRLFPFDQMSLLPGEMRY